MPRFIFRTCYLFRYIRRLDIMKGVAKEKGRFSFSIKYTCEIRISIRSRFVSDCLTQCSSYRNAIKSKGNRIIYTSDRTMQNIVLIGSVWEISVAPSRFVYVFAAVELAIAIYAHSKTPTAIDAMLNVELNASTFSKLYNRPINVGVCVRFQAVLFRCTVSCKLRSRKKSAIYYGVLKICVGCFCNYKYFSDSNNNI